MIYKRFTFLIVIRIVLLLVNVVTISLIFGDKRLFFNHFILGALLILQVVELVRFVTYTNQELTRFFQAIRYSDYAISFNKSILGASFGDLHQSMIDVIQIIQDAKIEKEAQFHFLQMLVNQLHIGIIALDHDDQVTLINPTAESITGIQGLKNWKLMRQHNPFLAQEIEQLGDNGKKLVEFKSPGETYFISADVRTLLIMDKPVRLITLQNINSEIEQKEIEAWHKLIRILTHEIMNSVTPIASLTETIQSMVEDQSGNEKRIEDMKQETLSDMRFSLSTIQKRTDGLLNFVDRYRKLTKVPRPVLQEMDIRKLVHTVEQLMLPGLTQKNIALHVSVRDDVSIAIDPVLIEQVLINMITNSMHAVAHSPSPTITLKSYRQENHVIIEVTDNGMGIPENEMSEIFVPFFTTKKDGSGIGLSLSKQIMNLHRGTIKVQSSPGSGTSFFLWFNAPRKN